MLCRRELPLNHFNNVKYQKLLKMSHYRDIVIGHASCTWHNKIIVLYCIVLYCIVLYCIMRPYTEGRLDRAIV